MDDDIIIAGVMFGDEGIRIDYMDKTFSNEDGALESALTISTKGFESLIEEMRSALADIVESYLIELRDPPATLPAGPRLSDYGKS